MDATPRPPDRFETKRLIARKPRVSDAAAVFDAYGTDPEVTRYMVWKPYTEIGLLEDYICHSIAEWDAGITQAFMLCLKGSDDPVGSIDISIRKFTAHFGYVLSRPHWGQGLMTEALTFLVNWSLAQPDIYRTTAYCDAENPGSARVMEKAGMEFEGIMKRGHIAPTIGPEPRDCRVYAKVR